MAVEQPPPSPAALASRRSALLGDLTAAASEPLAEAILAAVETAVGRSLGDGHERASLGAAYAVLEAALEE